MQNGGFLTRLIYLIKTSKQATSHWESSEASIPNRSSLKKHGNNIRSLDNSRKEMYSCWICHISLVWYVEDSVRFMVNTSFLKTKLHTNKRWESTILWIWVWQLQIKSLINLQTTMKYSLCLKKIDPLPFLVRPKIIVPFPFWHIINVPNFTIENKLYS